jgi:hypothetical protein
MRRIEIERLEQLVEIGDRFGEQRAPRTRWPRVAVNVHGEECRSIHRIDASKE